MGLTRIADSSFLIALYDEDDARHREAWGSAQQGEAMMVPPEVLAETLGVLGRRHGFESARGLLDSLRTLANLRFLESSAVSEIERVFVEANGSLSWVDAAVVAWCQRLKAQPLAFDRSIGRATEAGA